MDPFIRNIRFALIVAVIGSYSCNIAQAQRFDDLFEEPEDRPIVTLLSTEFLSKKSVETTSKRAPIEMIGLIEPADESVNYSYEPQSVCTECSTTECGPACQTVECRSKGLIDRRDEYRRKSYFSRNRTTKGTLYPVIRPYNQSGFGYYETCWKKMAPNPCLCPPDQGGCFTGAADDQFLLPIPAEAHPAPSYDK